MANEGPKIPKTTSFSGEGDDMKPEILGRWFREVKGYLRRHDIIDASGNVVEWYCDYNTGREKDAFMALQDEYEAAAQNLTMKLFKKRFKTLFQASTNKDDLWQQWQRV
jgi:hypothetical protein